MKRFLADLHIHTALSPCAEEEMTPAAIVRQAIRKGLAIIAICDHNTAGNTIAVQEAAGKDITVIAGMEITTVEEVHVIGLFIISVVHVLQLDIMKTAAHDMLDR